MRTILGLIAAVLAFSIGDASGAPRALANTGGFEEGVLTILYGDPEPGSGQRAKRIHLLHKDNGEVVELDISAARLPPGGISRLVNRRIRVKGDAAPVQAFGAPRKVKAHEIQALDDPPAPKDLSKATGNQPFVSLLCKFADNAAEPRTPAYFTTQLNSVAPGFNHYFQEVSYGLITLNGSTAAANWVTLPQTRAFYLETGKTPTVFLNEIFAHCTAAANSIVDFSGFHGINIMLNGTLDNAAWGGGSNITNLDGVSRSWPTTWMPYSGEANSFGWRRHSVLAHEMSHSFGAPHSEDPSGFEYGSQWDVVSSPGATCATVDPNYGCLGQSMNAYAKTIMGVITPARLATHNAGTLAYDIERLTQPPNAGGTYQMLRVNIAGTSARYYTVESRYRIGYDTQLIGDGVIIHEIDTTRGNDARLVVPGGGTGPGLGDADAIWLPGTIFSNATDNVSVAINSFSGTGTANVTVSPFVAPPPEVFPPDCLVPAGWSTPGGATTGWSVAIDSFAAGTCSLKSNVLANSPGPGLFSKAQIQFAGNFVAGNVTFMRRVSSEAAWDCLQFFIDGVKQNIGSSCTQFGVTGLSGELPWSSVSIPVTAGVHTLLWSYEKDNEVAAGSDAAWIDSVVLPLELGPPSVTFTAANFAVNENAGNATVSVARGGSIADPIGVSWAASDGGALAGEDFGTLGSGTQPSGTLAWAAGDGAPQNIVIPILQNTALESPETFTLTLSLPTGGASLGATPSATVTITDDDSIFDLAAATLSVAENGSNVNLTVNRTGSLATSADVTFTTTNGTAISGTDYGVTATPPSGVLTFGPGVGSRTIAIGPTSVAAPYVRVINDIAVEAPKAFTLALSAPTGGGQLGTTTSATVTINNDDGTVAMASATQSVAENTPTAQVQVNRASSAGAVSVGYSFTNVTALNGTHYTGTPGTLNWANGDNTPKFIAVPIIDNAAVTTTNRTFTVTIGTPTGAPLGTPSATSVTIAENDNTLQFTAPTFSANEGALVTLTVSRLGGTTNAASVDWITLDGTAVGGIDFTSTGGTLNWGVGDAATKNFTVQLLGDSVVTGNRAFQVQLLGSVAGATLGTQSLATVTRIDATSGVSFAQPAYTTAEGLASVSVQVARTGSTTGAIGVTWTTGNVGATSGQDFGVAGNLANRTGLLSWLAGDALAKTITIPILADTAFEGPETFTINLSAPTGGAALGTTPSTTVTINDDESTFQLSAAAVNVGEAGPNTTINVVRTGSTSVAQTVTWRATAGTATAISDFNAATGVLTFAIGETTKTITIGKNATPAPYIAIVDDLLFEGPETFTLALSAPTSGGVLGVPSSAIVTIISDERAVSMENASRNFPEGAGLQNIMVARSGLPTGALAVNYAVTNGSALNGTHYTAAGGTLNWADTDAASKPIPVTILDDAITNTSRTFTVTLSGASTGTSLVAPMSTVVTIADNDTVVQFTAPTITVAEGLAGGNLTLTLARTGVFTNPASVTYTTFDGTGLAGTDFGVLGNTTAVTGTVSWLAGVGGNKTFTIPILNDAIVEGAKTFTVQLSNPVGTNISIGANSQIAVTLSDNDAGLRFASATYDVTEGTPSIVLTVQRIGPATLAATATWATVNGPGGPGGAVSGQDFGMAGSALPRTGPLSWLAGDALPKTITIPIINDTVGGEGDETFTVVLTPGAGLVLGTPGIATVTIHDDDIPPETTVQFSAPKFSFFENVGSASLTVTRTDLGGPLSTLAASVRYSTVAGSALAVSDYTAVTLGTVNWGVSDFTDKTISIPLVNNAIAEPPESFKVVLSAPNPGTSIGAQGEATVWIVDDDEVFPLGGAMPVAGFSIPPLATTGWHVSNDPGAYEGAFALKSDEIDDGESAGIQMSGTFAAGNVTFRVKVSTEAGFDKLEFHLDGVLQTTWSGIAATGWLLSPTYVLSPGAHTLKWVYVKDGSVSVGLDAVYIDGLVTPAFTP